MAAPTALLAAHSATAGLPGTCGEWVQGTLDGSPCLVSCAIDWYAQVTVMLDGPPGRWRVPPGACKAGQALRRGLAARGHPPVGGSVRLANPLPCGRGYASSTADVAGTILALGLALELPFSPEEAARLSVAVEPSDGTMWPSPVLLAYQDAAFAVPLPAFPSMAVVVLDPGGSVDTIRFNAADHRAALKRLAPWHRDIFATFQDALAARDPAQLAVAATQSALAQQALLPSELVSFAAAQAGRLGALGICRAHSGTLAGLLCLPAAGEAVAGRAREAFPGATVRLHRCLGSDGPAGSRSLAGIPKKARGIDRETI